MLRRLLSLDVSSRLGSREDPLGPVGGQAVLSHEFFDEVDFEKVLSPSAQNSWHLDESVHSYRSENVEKKLDRDLQFNEFESFEDALISWSVKANLTKAIYQSDPMSMSRSGHKEKSRLKREVDEEQFGQWDYMSAETVQHEMLATDRHSNLVELKSTTSSQTHSPDSSGHSIDIMVSDNLDITRHKGVARTSCIVSASSTPSLFDVSSHSVLDMSNPYHNETMINVGGGGDRIAFTNNLTEASSLDRLRRDEFDEDELEVLGAAAINEVLSELEVQEGSEFVLQRKREVGMINETTTRSWAETEGGSSLFRKREDGERIMKCKKQEAKW